ncbi:hypothetical protein OIU78_013893 [Salix suchowensis]|nr:hypothetical protein OIU78_013893 [Salix suchowensis]
MIKSLQEGSELAHNARVQPGSELGQACLHGPSTLECQVITHQLPSITATVTLQEKQASTSTSHSALQKPHLKAMHRFSSSYTYLIRRKSQLEKLLTF